MNSIEEPKSIYVFLLFILLKIETMIFAAGPAEIKNIRLLFFASRDNLEINSLP